METRGNPGEVITESEKNRAGAIYAEDAGCEVRKSHENPAVTKIYGEFLTDGPCGEKSHHLPHTHCVARVKYID